MKSPLNVPQIQRAGRHRRPLPLLLLPWLVLCLAPPRLGAQSDPLDQWTSYSPGTGAALFGIAYGNGLFVAVGDAGTILTSTDGASWTLRDTTNLLQPNLLELGGVASGNGLFVAVGYRDGLRTYGVLLTSTDGATWTIRNFDTVWSLFGAAYANGRFVAVGGGPRRS